MSLCPAKGSSIGIVPRLFAAFDVCALRFLFSFSLPVKLNNIQFSEYHLEEDFSMHF